MNRSRYDALFAFFAFFATAAALCSALAVVAAAASCGDTTNDIPPKLSLFADLNRRSVSELCCNITSGSQCCDGVLTRCCQASVLSVSRCCDVGADCCEDVNGAMTCCPSGSSCCGFGCCADTSTCCPDSTCCPADTQCCGGACCSDTCFYDEYCINTFGLSQNASIGVAAGIAAVLVLLVIVLLYCCCCAGNSPRQRKRKKKSDYEMGSLAHSPRPATTVATVAQPTVTIVTVPAPTTYPAASPAPAAIITTTTATSTPPDVSEQTRQQLLRALQSVQQAINVALMGIATEKLSMDDGVSLMAVAATNALQSCQCTNEQEFQRNATIVFNFMDSMFRERIPSMPQERREEFIRIIVQRMVDLAHAGKKQRLEEALELIKQSVVIAWHGFMSNNFSLEDSQILMATAVAAALRNCVITTTEDLKAHMAAFNTWMMVVANECAPAISHEVKEEIIRNVWVAVAGLF